MWCLGLLFYCFPKCCFCCCISADLRPGSSQTYRGLFEERENDSFFKCLSVYVYSRMFVPSKEDNGLCSVCVCMGALVQDLKSATSLLGSGCIALKIVYLTVIATFPCWPHLQAILPTLILLSISSERHNFLRCFLSVFCELFKQYCVLPVL